MMCANEMFKGEQVCNGAKRDIIVREDLQS